MFELFTSPAVLLLTLWLLYVLVVGVLVGRNKVRRDLPPSVAPPEGFSPAALRFIHRMGHDYKTLAVALTGLAMRGAITIEFDGLIFTLRPSTAGAAQRLRSALLKQLARGERSVEVLANRLDVAPRRVRDDAERLRQAGFRVAVGRETIEVSGALPAAPTPPTPPHLFADEQALLQALFHGTLEKITVDDTYQWFWRYALRVAQGERYRGQYGSRLFRGNYVYLLPTVLLAAFAVVQAWPWSVEELYPPALCSTGGVLGLGFVLPCWFKLVRGQVYRPWLMGGVWLFCTAIAAWALSAGLRGDAAPLEFIAILIMAVWGTLLFARLVKSPTPEGRMLMEQIAAYRRFLLLPQREARQVPGYPGHTPETFLAHLEAALALDVERAWAAQFSDVCANTPLDLDWYRETAPVDAALLARRLGSELPGAVFLALHGGLAYDFRSHVTQVKP